MPGPISEAVSKKVGGALGGKAKQMPLIKGKGYKPPKAKLMPIVKGKNYQPPKAELMPGKTPRRKMSAKYDYKTASYHTRKKANVERVHLGLKEKPGRY